MRQSDWSSALYKALEHAQRTLQTKIEGLHVQRSRLGAHDDLIEVTKKNVTEESQQLQTQLKKLHLDTQDAASAAVSSVLSADAASEEAEGEFPPPSRSRAWPCMLAQPYHALLPPLAAQRQIAAD